MEEKKSRRKGKAKMEEVVEGADFHSKLHLFFLQSSVTCANTPTPTQTCRSTQKHTQIHKQNQQIRPTENPRQLIGSVKG